MNILYNTGGEFMISFYCQKLLSEYSNQLQEITQNAISETLLIIPGLFEPPVRTLRATIPENESHIFR